MRARLIEDFSTSGIGTLASTKSSILSSLLHLPREPRSKCERLSSATTIFLLICVLKVLLK